MAKQYGKNINMHKFANKRPSNSKIPPKMLHFIQGVNTTNAKNTRFVKPIKFQNPRGEGETSTRFAINNNKNPSYNDPFYLFLLDNAVCQISESIKPGTATSINIANPTSKLGGDYLIRRGDNFWIYNRRSFYSKKVQAAADVMDADTSISIMSTVFTIHNKLPSGSLVVPDYKIQTQRVSNAPLLRYMEIDNTDYGSLHTGIKLIDGQSDKLIIPLSATIIYEYDTTEETSGNDLFIGHNPTYTTPQKYWSMMESAFYRLENNALYQMTAGTYGSRSDLGLPAISIGNDGIGNDLAIYTSGTMNGGGSLKIWLYYKEVYT